MKKIQTFLFCFIACLGLTSCLGDETYIYYNTGFVEWDGDESHVTSVGECLSSKGASFGTICYQGDSEASIAENCTITDTKAREQFKAMVEYFSVDEVSSVLPADSGVSFTYAWYRTVDTGDGYEVVYIGKWYYPSGEIEY